jgi:hypothetical protein
MSERVSDEYLRGWSDSPPIYRSGVERMASELLEYRAVGTPEQCAEWKRRAALNELAQIDHEIARPTPLEALERVFRDRGGFQLADDVRNARRAAGEVL